MTEQNHKGEDVYPPSGELWQRTKGNHSQKWRHLQHVAIIEGNISADSELFQDKKQHNEQRKENSRGSSDLRPGSYEKPCHSHAVVGRCGTETGNDQKLAVRDAARHLFERMQRSGLHQTFPKMRCGYSGT